MNAETGSPASPTIIVENLTVKLDAQQLSNNGNSTGKTAGSSSECISRHCTRRINGDINSLGKSQTRENRIWGDTASQRPARLGSAGFEKIGGGYRVKKIAH